MMTHMGCYRQWSNRNRSRYDYGQLLFSKWDRAEYYYREYSDERIDSVINRYMNILTW